MFYLKHRGVLIYSVTDAIRCPHGFSTRSGGVSTLEHLATMNFTTSTGDSEENVAENYRIFLSALGLDPASRVSSHQIHSTKVRYVTEADAASFVNLSYSYYSKLFRRVVGKNFNDYLTTVRINEAERLLLSTEQTITEIALATGFATSSHFIEKFRKIKNITPKQ